MTVVPISVATMDVNNDEDGERISRLARELMRDAGQIFTQKQAYKYAVNTDAVSLQVAKSNKLCFISHDQA